MPGHRAGVASAIAGPPVQRGVRDGARRTAAGAIAVALRRSAAPIGFAVVYHRVDDHADEPARRHLPALSRRLFEVQVRHLAGFYSPVRGGELLDAIRNRRRDEPIPVAVTFDDDLESHARVVVPTLSRAGVRATFFLSGTTEGDGPRRWWDDLQVAVDRTLVRRDSLGPALAPALGAALAWKPWAIHAVAREIVRLPPADRAAIAAVLRSAVARLPPPPTLTPEQVRAFADQGHEIGFHTRGHHPLASLDEAELADAITDGRAALEGEAAGSRVAAIAYPHGSADARVVEAAARAGFRAGFTTTAEAIGPRAEALRLGRIAPSFSSVGEFAITIARRLLEVSRADAPLGRGAHAR